MFSLLFAAVLFDALSQSYGGIKIHYQANNQLFELRCLKARTKAKETIITDYLYTDDCALPAHSKSDIQALANFLAVLARKLGLDISLQKTEIMLQPASDITPSEPFFYN